MGVKAEYSMTQTISSRLLSFTRQHLATRMPTVRPSARDVFEAKSARFLPDSMKPNNSLGLPHLPGVRSLANLSRRTKAHITAARDPHTWMQWARGHTDLPEPLRSRLLQVVTHLSSDAELARMVTEAPPLVAVALLRILKIDRGRPAFTQELNNAVLNPTGHDRAVAMRRLASTVNLLPRNEVQQKLTENEKDLLRVEWLLDRAQRLDLASLRGDHSLDLGADNAFIETPVPMPDHLTPKIDDGKCCFSGEDIAALDIRSLQAKYRSGNLSPIRVAEILLRHPLADDSAVFPRDLNSPELRILELARASEARYRSGDESQIRPLEGVLVAVKDLVAGVDGKMNFGSKSAHIKGMSIEQSPVVKRLLELGAIPVPVGMVAGANGSTGRHNGWGVVEHPDAAKRHLDIGGSSTGSGRVLGDKHIPIVVATGSQTGGSIMLVSGPTGLYAVSMENGMISRKNMVAFDPEKDRLGALAVHSGDEMLLARYLSMAKTEGDPTLFYNDPQTRFQKSKVKPRVVYFPQFQKTFSKKAQAHTDDQLQRLRDQGYETVALGHEWEWILEVPSLLYAKDTHPVMAIGFDNPTSRGSRADPRSTIDGNLQRRMSWAFLTLASGQFDWARDLSAQYTALMYKLFPNDVVILTPSPEAIPVKDIEQGTARFELRRNDSTSMQQNRVDEWAQRTWPQTPGSLVGVVATGTTQALMWLNEEPTP
jgi:Asp-tRNA(Asn)/Glu-tRNA(Gln) amidotransferase A subunit family amidase